MNYDNRDNDFVARVSNALYTRMNINTNKLNGHMTLCGADPYDHVNPELKLSKEEIKQGTGRTKVREVKLDEFRADFQKRGIDASVVKQENGEHFLHLKITPERAREVKFDSLNSIEKQNESDLEDDTELGTAYYDY